MIEPLNLNHRDLERCRLRDVIEPISASADHRLPSNRRFGLFLFVILIILAILSEKKDDREFCLFYNGLAVCVLFVSFLKSNLLKYLNQAWFQLGRIIGKVTNPIVLGVLFFLLLTPVAIVSRRFKRDVLNLNGMNLETLWVMRDSQQSSSQDFERQF